MDFLMFIIARLGVFPALHQQHRKKEEQGTNGTDISTKYTIHVSRSLLSKELGRVLTNRTISKLSDSVQLSHQRQRT